MTPLSEVGGEGDYLDPVTAGSPVVTGTKTRPLPCYGDICHSLDRSKSLASKLSRIDFEGYSRGSTSYSFVRCTSRGLGLRRGSGRSFSGHMAGAGPSSLGEGEMSTMDNYRNHTAARTYEPPCSAEDYMSTYLGGNWFDADRFVWLLSVLLWKSAVRNIERIVMVLGWLIGVIVPMFRCRYAYLYRWICRGIARRQRDASNG